MTQETPQDWIQATKAICWGEWFWPQEIFREIQQWGDQHCCRFILVSEVSQDDQYRLILYIAPKPNRTDTGLCALSVENRDRYAPVFDTWFEGFLVGRGFLLSANSVRLPPREKKP